MRSGHYAEVFAVKTESCGSCPSKSACGGGCERSEQELAEMYDLDADTTEGVMVWAEWTFEDGVPVLKDGVPELLTLAKGLEGQRVLALIYGPEQARSLASELYAWGADTVYHVRHPGFDEHLPRSFSEGFAAVAERARANTALFLAGDNGDELALGTGALLEVPVATGVTGLKMDGGRLLMSRPAFGGALEACVVSDGRPQIATVRKGSYRAEGRREGRRGTVINWPMKPVEGTDGPAPLSKGKRSELLISVEDAPVGTLEQVRGEAEGLASPRTGRAAGSGPRAHLRLAEPGTPWPQRKGPSPDIIAVDGDASERRIMEVGTEGDMGALLDELLGRLERMGAPPK